MADFIILLLSVLQIILNFPRILREWVAEENIWTSDGEMTGFTVCTPRRV